MMPNFLTIGAPKAGTSSLYYYLKQHPQIYLSPIKEPHFFALENSKIDFQGAGDKERYHHAVTSLQDYSKLFEAVTTETAIGEASTTYLSSKSAPARIKQYIPQAKLIAILRNPVDAAYSSYLHLLRDGDETIKDFELALQAEERRIQQNWDGIWHYKNRGFYYAQLKRYFDLFERSQIKVYLYQDFKLAPLQVLQNIFNFLEVETSFSPNIEDKFNVSAVPKNILLNQIILKPNILKSSFKAIFPHALSRKISHRFLHWNLQSADKQQMLNKTRQKLSLEYKEDILKLQDLIQQDLTAWLVK